MNQKIAGEAIATDWAGGLADGCVELTDINEAVAAEGTAAALEEAKAKLISGELHVFDTSTFTVGGETLTTFTVDGKEVVFDGYFHESEVKSAPYFSLQVDGIEMLVD